MMPYYYGDSPRYYYYPPRDPSPTYKVQTPVQSLAEQMGVDPVSKLADAINNLADALRGIKDETE